MLIECKEFESILLDSNIIISNGKLDIYEESSRYVSFTLTKEGVVARSKQFVGIIPINERVTLRVVPRVPVQSLTRIVSWLGMDTVVLTGTRTYGSSDSTESWMRDLLIDAYLQSLEGLRDKGIQREYFSIKEIGTTPKGRINHSSTARLWGGGKFPQTSYSWYERSAQTEANEILKAALEHSARILNSHSFDRTKRGVRVRIRRLNAMLHTFREVSLSTPTTNFGDKANKYQESFPPHLSHYHQPINIARRILNDGGIELEGNGELLLGTSLLVDMGDLFERLVRIAISRSFAQQDKKFVVLDGNSDEDAQLSLYLDPDESVRSAAPHRNAAVLNKNRKMTPDIVINDAVGGRLLVADVKNKLIGPLPDREDVEQVLAYAIRFGVKNALLIYPRSRNLDSGLQAVGVIGDVRIYQYHYELESVDLMKEANILGQALSHLLAAVITE